MSNRIKVDQAELDRIPLADSCCEHAPARFAAKRHGDVDTSVKAVEKALDAAWQLIEGGADSLLLSGPVGCGKSMIAAVICHEVAEPDMKRARVLVNRDKALRSAGEPKDPQRRQAAFLEAQDVAIAIKYAGWDLKRDCPRWLSVPLLLAGLRREIGADSHHRPMAGVVEDVLKHSGSLLVLDDLGAEKSSDWTADVLFELVESRYATEGGQLIVTSNRSATELAGMGYERLVSRIAENGLLVQMTRVGDYRMTLRRSVA